MIRIDIDDDNENLIAIEAPLRFKEVLREIPGSGWSATLNRWRLPLTWSSCIAMRETFGADLEIGPALTKWASEYVALLERTGRIRELLKLPEDVELEGLPEGLFPHQRVDVAFMMEHRRAMLFSEQGTGKSASTVTTLRMLAAQGETVTPGLIVCPSSVKTSWQREFARWWPDANVVVVAGNATQRRKQLQSGADFYIMNYEAVRGHSRMAPYGSIALRRCEDCGGSGAVSANLCDVHVRELNEIDFNAAVVDECFVADKLISTPEGPRRIADIAVGDAVWGYDHELDSVVPAVVMDTFQRPSTTIIDGVGATPNHPYFCVGDGYRAIGDLLPTDKVLYLDETMRTVHERVLSETHIHAFLLDCLQERGAESAILSAALLDVREGVSPGQQSPESEVLHGVVHPRAGSYSSTKTMRSVWSGVQAGSRDDAGMFQALWGRTGRANAEHTSADTVLLVWSRVQTEELDPEVLFQELSILAHTITTPTRGETKRDARGSTEPSIAGVPDVGAEPIPFNECGESFCCGEEGLGKRCALHQPQACGDTRATGAALCASGCSCRVCHFVYTGGSPTELRTSGSLLPGCDADYRSGWRSAQESAEVRQGQGSGRASALVGVDRHPLLELRSPEQYERVRRASARDDKQIVYSLTTSTGNYFADDFLVRNCHRIKDPSARQTRAINAATKGAGVRFALTGTPIANSALDMWSILHFVDPEQWPTRTKWSNRFLDIMYNVFGGIVVSGIRPERMDEFDRTTTPLMRRMTKDVVLPFLPPVVAERRDIPMNPKQDRAYRALALNMMTMLESGLLVASSVLTQTIRLSQLASSYGEVERDDETGDEKFVLSAPSSKISAFMEDLGDFEGRTIVVFAVSRQLIMLLSAALDKEGVAHSLIVGGQTERERQSNIDNFQNGRTKLILVTIAAGGTGLTLTAADTMVFLQRSWSAVEMEQAAARAHRIGSEKHESIMRVDYVAPGTIEEAVLEALEGKGAALQDIVRDAELLRKVLALRG